MTEIKILKAVGGHKAGDTINTAKSAAEYLINTGYAEAVESEAKATRGRSKKADSETGGGAPSDASPITAG